MQTLIETFVNMETHNEAFVFLPNEMIKLHLKCRKTDRFCFETSKDVVCQDLPLRVPTLWFRCLFLWLSISENFTVARVFTTATRLESPTASENTSYHITF